MYQETINKIKMVCSRIILHDPKKNDGRDDSKDLEISVIKELIKYIPDIQIEIPPPRSWFDIKIDGLFFNIKITSGKCGDNAYNKKAVLYTLTGDDSCPNVMNHNEFFQFLSSKELKKTRDYRSEYHYIVLFKDSPGKYLVKSIIDIHKYIPNASNNIQINWSKEYSQQHYETTQEKYQEKVISLLESIQDSLKKRNEEQFINANLHQDIKFRQ